MVAKEKKSNMITDIKSQDDQQTNRINSKKSQSRYITITLLKGKQQTQKQGSVQTPKSGLCLKVEHTHFLVNAVKTEGTYQFSLPTEQTIEGAHKGEGQVFSF